MIKRAAVTAAVLLIAGLIIIGGIVEISRRSAHPVSLFVAAVLAVLVWMLISRADVPLLLRALDGLRAILPVFAFMITSLFVGSSQGGIGFDEVAAQVIAVLLLALSLEARFFRLRGVREPLELGATLFTMLVLGCGELYALQGIAVEGSSHTDTISGAIAAGFVAVAVAALTGPTDDAPGGGDS
jgi:hypothetical protein